MRVSLAGPIRLLFLLAAACLVGVGHRAHAATFAVDTVADGSDDAPGDGTCSAGGQCTLRAAIDEANALAGADTITVPAGTYGFGAVGGASSLEIASDLTITGAGSPATILNGAVFQRVIGIVAAATVVIEDMTIMNGLSGTDDGCGGGGICNGLGNLTLRRMLIQANLAQLGGAIANGVSSGSGAFLEIVDSTITGNQALGDLLQGIGGAGGGLLNYGTAVIENSTFDHNLALATVGIFGGGGALRVIAGSVVVRNSTITDNVSGHGEAIMAIPETLCSPSIPGCITVGAGTVLLENVTVAGNDGMSPAILSDRTTIRNTIVADNAPADCYPSLISAGYNLVEDLTDASVTCTVTGDPTGNQIGVDPQLGPLAPNGGPTRTMAPAATSPVLEAGNPAIPGSGGNACLAADQRHVARPQGVRCDIGAVEREPATCGNGIVELGELCDDGNTSNDDCCPSACVPAASGTSCGGDGDLCTTDACNATGACIHTPLTTGCCAPASCGSAAKAMLSIRRPVSRPPSFNLKIVPSPAVAKTDFGNPNILTGVDVCVFEQGSGDRKLLASVPFGGTCQGKPCWKETARGFRYRDRQGTIQGVRSILLKSGAAAKAQIAAKGRGATLRLEPLPLATPLRIEVRRSDASICWGGDLATAR
jgi:CSLREA domain-containing protein